MKEKNNKWRNIFIYSKISKWKENNQQQYRRNNLFISRNCK